MNKESSLYEAYKRMYPLSYKAIMKAKGWDITTMKKQKSLNPVLIKSKKLKKTAELFTASVIKSAASSIKSLKKDTKKV